MHSTCLHFKGFRPEWCISTIYHCRDTPFWWETLNLFLYLWRVHLLPVSSFSFLCLQFLCMSVLPHVFQFVCWLVGCLTSQQQAGVSQGRICQDNFTCCHTEIEVADQTFYLTQSQYTDAGPTSPSADPITPGAWQGSHWSANF